MDKIKRALELINTFSTGDVNKASELIAQGYIQHNLSYGTGAYAFIRSVKYLAGCSCKDNCKKYPSF